MKLSPNILLNAYSQGIFPMADDDGTIYWYDPNPRAILPLENFHTPRRLARQVRQGIFDLRVNTAFRAVMEACAEPAPDRENTWISPEIVDIYCELHSLGFAHSVEAWQEGDLVGGLYGVTLAGLFAGESMFSRATDSSKIALVYLVDRLRQRGFTLLDVQFTTDHLKRFGVIEIPRQAYKARLDKALRQAWARFE
ncbi:MAG: leucyl/phenylalanyl-tRNA--protein transferase [Chloroflexota bacterium]